MNDGNMKTGYEKNEKKNRIFSKLNSYGGVYRLRTVVDPWNCLGMSAFPATLGLVC
jgi:hypothetical protein